MEILREKFEIKPAVSSNAAGCHPDTTHINRRNLPYDNVGSRISANRFTGLISYNSNNQLTAPSATHTAAMGKPQSGDS